MIQEGPDRVNENWHCLPVFKLKHSNVYQYQCEASDTKYAVRLNSKYTIYKQIGTQNDD